jgi:hypothetical protein
VSQIVFTLFGLALLLTWYQGIAMGPWLVGGVSVSVVAAAGFILAQRKGLFRFLERLPELLDLKWAWTVLPDAEGIHAGIKSIYRHYKRVLTSALLAGSSAPAKPGSASGSWVTL